MFSVITGNLAEQIDTLKKVLDTHDSLRALIFPPVDVGGEGVIQAAAGNEHGPEIVADNLFRKQIHNSAPTKSSWQVYDHCAVFTRLYAVYEQFIENLV
jgi:hypothetical protein